MEFFNKVKDLWQRFDKSKKAQIITLIVILVIAALIGGFFVFWKKPVKETKTNENVNTPVSAEGEEEFPIAVVIENLITARQYQAGLAEADIVYEALAEGGITRFLAVYTKAKTLSLIGPVRSARTYYVDWAEEFSGLFAHIGGSPQALGMLHTEDYLYDLNQFSYGKYYWRDVNIGAPHNLFTSSELLAFARRDEVGEEVKGDWEKWPTKDGATKEERPTEEKYIKINFSSDSYFVEYKYDRENNVYLRFNAGQEHKDKSEQQISAKNIIVQYVETSLLEPSTGRLTMKTIGEGKAVVFRDGQAVTGTWRKEERGARTKFYDEAGEKIKLNKGTTWVEVVPTDRSVEYN